MYISVSGCRAKSLVQYGDSDEEQDSVQNQKPKREPLSLDQLIAKKAEEEARESKVRDWQSTYSIRSLNNFLFFVCLLYLYLVS